MDDSDLEMPACPICAGTMEVVYNRHRQIVAVCPDCHSGLTVPDDAWRVARIKAAQTALKPKKTG